VLPVARRCFLSMLISGAAPLFQIVSATSRPFTLRYRRQHARHHSGPSQCGSSAAKPLAAGVRYCAHCGLAVSTCGPSSRRDPRLIADSSEFLSSWLSGVEHMPTARSGSVHQKWR
jgi:hypothetical protein